MTEFKRLLLISLTCILASCSVNGDPPPATEVTLDGLSYTVSPGQLVREPWGGHPAADTTSGQYIRTLVEAVVSVQNVADTTVHANLGGFYAKQLYREGDWSEPVVGYDPKKDYGVPTCAYPGYGTIMKPGQVKEFPHLALTVYSSPDDKVAPGAYRVAVVIPDPLCGEPSGPPNVQVQAPEPIQIPEEYLQP